MIHKHLIDPRRCRRIPQQFSWVDHRLVQQGYIQRCSHRALALYLLLLTVADAEGLSYYGEATLCKRLGMNEQELASARGELLRIGLIAFRHPLYQVLSLDPPAPSSQSSASASSAREARTVDEVLRNWIGGEG